MATPVPYSFHAKVKSTVLLEEIRFVEFCGTILSERMNCYRTLARAVTGTIM
jgi:hypothetical protein